MQRLGGSGQGAESRKGQGLHSIPVPTEDWGCQGDDKRFKDQGTRGWRGCWGGEGCLASWDRRVRLLEGALQPPDSLDRILSNSSVHSLTPAERRGGPSVRRPARQRRFSGNGTGPKGGTPRPTTSLLCDSGKSCPSLGLSFLFL